MHKLISTLVYLDGEFVKRTSTYHQYPFNDLDALLKRAVVDVQFTVVKFALVTCNRGECTVGDIIKLPKQKDGSYSYMFNAEMNGHRFSYYVQVADTLADCI